MTTSALYRLNTSIQHNCNTIYPMSNPPTINPNTPAIQRLLHPPSGLERQMSRRIWDCAVTITSVNEGGYDAIIHTDHNRSAHFRPNRIRDDGRAVLLTQEEAKDINYLAGADPIDD